MARRWESRISIALVAILAGITPCAETNDPPAPVSSSGSGQVRGTVSTARRTPAVGAVVIVRPQDAQTPVRLATTGAAGTFAFDGLADGTYRADVRRDGFAPVQKSGIVVKAPFRAVVEVTLARGVDASPAGEAPTAVPSGVRGRVRSAAREPLAEARVRLVRPDGRDDPRAALTNAMGGFAFEGLVAGRWRLEILGAGLLPLRADVDLVGEVELEAALAAQPADYQPAARDLLVPEDVLPPPGS